MRWKLGVCAMVLVLCRVSAAHVLDRVVAIGASATDGFGAVVAVDKGERTVHAKVELDEALRACMKRDGCEVASLGDIFFFASPINVGPGLLEPALAMKPTLVVGIDFLFWYGYGENDKDGNPITDESARLALLEEGLKQLERVECPLVIGDFPDMSGAIGLMLTKAQVPKAETLAKLNQRVREWAKGRSKVMVAPLGQLIADMNEGKPVVIGSLQWPEGSQKTLLQRDRLHPTAEGMLCLAMLAVRQVAEAGLEIQEHDLVTDLQAARQTMLKLAAAQLAPPATQPAEKKNAEAPAPVGEAAPSATQPAPTRPPG
jgi:hypothetical protein